MGQSFCSSIVSVGLDGDGNHNGEAPKVIPFANGTAIWALDFDFPDGKIFYTDMASGVENIRLAENCVYQRRPFSIF